MATTRQQTGGNERISRLLEIDRTSLPVDGGPRFNRLIFRQKTQNHPSGYVPHTALDHAVISPFNYHRSISIRYHRSFIFIQDYQIIFFG